MTTITIDRALLEQTLQALVRTYHYGGVIAADAECITALRAALAQPNTAQQVVDEQAEDEALWFVAQTAPEAYLQQALRRLHAAVEGAARAAIKAVEGEQT